MLQAQQQRRDAEQADSEFDGILLMENEQIQSSLGMSGSNASARQQDIVLLTDKRLIHISGSGNKKRSVFASIEDISLAEITRQPEGYAAYIWAALAFFVAVMLWRTIESPTTSLLTAIAVVLMGVYLIVDRLTSAGTPIVVFRTNGSEICSPIGKHAQPDAEALIAALFDLKYPEVETSRRNPDTFAPR